MITIQEEIGARIRVIRNGMGLTQAELGDRLNLSKSSISCYESGSNDTSPGLLIKISKLTGRSLEWLITGKEVPNGVAESQEEYTATMPVRALAGAGNPCCIDQLEPIGEIIVQKSYYGPNIQVVQIRGTSMEPTVMNGAHVGIDVTSKEIISGQMYAVYIPHEGIVVKRIWIGPELVKIASDNPSAPDHDMMSERINWDTFVQGRVKWVIQEY